MDELFRRLVIAIALVAIAAAALIYKVVYSLFLHPLAGIPGPKYAAITHYYQFYYDVVRQGRFPWKLKEWHEKYGTAAITNLAWPVESIAEPSTGPVIRIGPNEVHVADPDFYDELYASAAHPRDRDVFEISGFGLPDAVLQSSKYSLHRMRRAALNPYFSNQAINRIETVVREKLEALCGKLREVISSGESINLDLAFMALTTDIITQYCFAKSYDFIRKPGFSPEWLEATHGAVQASMLGRYLPFLPSVMKAMPPWLVKALSPAMMQLIIYTKDQEAQVRAIKNGDREGDMKEGQHTIIHELFESKLPPAEKTVYRIAQEAQTLVAGGSATTSFFLRSTMYYVLANKDVLSRLQAELKEHIPDPAEIPPWHQLQKLPFLSAVVKEGGRIVPGAFSRLGRIAPNEDLRCGEYVLPAGTIMSMSTWIQHNNTTLFPEPELFLPDRWLDLENGKKLEKYLVPFSKGSRGCLGINLAYVEIYTTLAMIFRRFEFDLYETTKDDVEIAHDFFLPVSRLDSRGVRVLVKGALE